MNAFSADSFGDMSSLLAAIGLVTPTGEFNSDWLGEPASHLKRILSDRHQRESLLEFVQAVRDGSTERDAGNRQWVELFSESLGGGSTIKFFLVLDDQPVNDVHLFVGFQFITDAPLARSTSSLMFPAFRIRKDESAAPALVSPVLAGNPGGHIALTTEITITSSAALPGEAGLSAIGLNLSIPTDATDGAPQIGLTLRDLQLPGQSVSSDLELSLADPDALSEVGIDLIVSLLTAQVGTAAGPQITALAKLIGLANDASIPNLPVEDILERGVDALADWLAEALRNPAATDAWLQALADVFANGASVSGGNVVLPVGGAQVQIGIDAVQGASGRPIITLTTGFELEQGSTSASITADLVRFDLGARTATAVPSISAQARFDFSGVTMPDVSIDSFVLGFGLNEARRPVLIAQVRDAVIFNTAHARLDLTNPDAVAAAATQAVGDALIEVLGNLGPAGNLIAVALGWSAPTGASATYPTIDLLLFLSDPLATLKSHWQNVLDNHTGDVPAVLGSVRHLITGDASTGVVTGTGSDTTPWLLPLAAGLHVAVWRDAANRLLIGVGFNRSVDTLGERCTVIETRIRIALVSVDLETSASGFLPEIIVRVLGRARGGGNLVTEHGSLMLEAEHIGALCKWTPDNGLSIRHEAPGAALFLDDIKIPMTMPDFSGNFDDLIDSFTDEHWDALERIVALLAEQSNNTLLNDLVDALGWRRKAEIFGKPPRHRLRLASLINDASVAIPAWLTELISDGESQLSKQLEPLAKFFSAQTDAAFSIDGAGSFIDPLRISLSDTAGLPALAVWREPDVPLPAPDSQLSGLLRKWRPGKVGLQTGDLARALLSEYPAIFGPFGTAITQETVQAGLQALAALWQGSDGLVRPPVAATAGTTLHLITNKTARTLIDEINLFAILDAAAATTITVQVVDPEAALDSAQSADQVLDMREAGRDPLAFTPLPNANGEWRILLAPRSAAALSTGDPEGVLGQVARLKHALSLIAAQPGATVIADAAAGHAAWLALNDLSPLNKLVLVGLPLEIEQIETEQIPAALVAPAAQMLRRLAEFLPDESTAEPDDSDLAAARNLIATYLDAAARTTSELSPPASWSGAKRAALDIHLAYGVFETAAVQRAMTAVLAAGLSLNAQLRVATSALKKITSASLGTYLPLNSVSPTGALAVQGHALVELLGLDIDAHNPLPVPRRRQVRRVVVATEISRQDGWIIGSPTITEKPLPLELRSVEISLRVALGGVSDTTPDSFDVILHGVRINGRAFPRLVLSSEVAQTDLGIDGLAAPATPEIRQLLSRVLEELADSGNAEVARVVEALRAIGILDGGDSFDAMSLSNWIDDPAARLRELLLTPALRTKLESLIAELAAKYSGLTYDPAAGTLSVALNGSTGEPLFNEWSLAATASVSGNHAGFIRLGSVDATNLAVAFAPFNISLNVGAQEAEKLGGLPPSLPIWPSLDLSRFGKIALPTITASVFSRLLNGLRNSDPGVKPLLDAALTAFGLISTTPDGDRVVVPPLMFISPALWLKQDTVVGDVTGSTIRADRVIGVMDALRPFVNLPGGSGSWEIDAGITLRARNDSGLVLELVLDPAQFLSASDINIGGSFGLRYSDSGSVQPAIAIFTGLASATTAGRSAVYLSVEGSNASLFLRNATGSDLQIYPDTTGLTQLATAGVVAALPEALDAIVNTGSGAGNLLADVGDALQLRSGGKFSASELADWAIDPAAKLENRWPQLLSAGLARLDPALPTGIGVNTTASGVQIQVDDVGTAGSTITIGFNTSPFSVELGASINAVPFLQTVETTMLFNSTGLSSLSATVGPANIPLTDSITLRPVMSVTVGASTINPNISLGLAIDDANSNALVLRYAFNTSTFSLGFGADTQQEIAAGIMHFAIDLVGSFIMELPAVQDIVNEPAGSTTIGELLSDVALTPNGGLDAELFRVIPNVAESASELLDSKLARVFNLLDNIAQAGLQVDIGNQLSIGLDETSGSISLSMTLSERLPIVDGDVSLWIENDNRWIIGAPTAGVVLGLIKRNASAFEFAAALSINGLGLRVGRNNAPLLDNPIKLGSIAFHVYAAINSTENLGGVQVQLSDIAIAMGGAQGGNPIAQSILAETNNGDTSLAPAFSPAMSVQTRPAADGGGLAFSFVAGEGEGPWWLPIRRQFGPLYVDQIGLGTQIENDSLNSLSLLFDGNISIAGLDAAVDDLSITHRLNQGSLFDAASWSVDLAGLAVAANMSGVSLAGGLRKFEEGDVTEYIGMLSARFGTFGLSIFGGYASIEGDDPYTAFFAFGAVLAPFGGPPAFFLTGIGGGFGINRDIVPPTDMSQFDDFVMIAALDPSFSPPGGLMEYMGDVRATFPPAKDRFWFAAGLSFTSFALVDGVAVVAVEFGQGFELSIFGLARLALPRPQVALVSIELGLMARFSTEEGVLWIQAQLTDNSWLLHPSARLTGGFAFVSWFKGDKAGQFVITLGGYHPSFQREGYPVVPRLGFNWSVSDNIVVKAENYFALTSEALMAGGLFEATAQFGVAFAHLSFGGNAIVYFDPFWYEADAHARVSAGIRISTWLGDINLSFSLGASIKVAGPEFHGVARVEVGPIDITVRFGQTSPPDLVYITWIAFAKKYLELAPGNIAQALSGIAGRGSLPPSSSGNEEAGTSDGSAAHPYEVMSEFELSFTSTTPISQILKGQVAVANAAPSTQLGIAPIGTTINDIKLTLELHLRDEPEGVEFLSSRADQISVTARDTGKFPIGVWGAPQEIDDKKVPKGDVITATEGVDLAFTPKFPDPIPVASTGGIAFEQVAPGTRKPLPLKAAGSLRTKLVKEANAQRKLLERLDARAMTAFSTDFQSINQSATSKRSWSRERGVPMRVGLLSERIVASGVQGRKRIPKRPAAVDNKLSFGDLKLRGLLTQTIRASANIKLAAVTAVTGATAKGLKRITPPTLSSVAVSGRNQPALLLRTEAETPIVQDTLVAHGEVVETGLSRRAASNSVRNASGVDLLALNGVEAMVRSGAMRSVDNVKPRALVPGEIAVFDLPGAKVSPLFESSGALEIRGPARLVVVGLDGRVKINSWAAKTVIQLPKACRSFAVMAGVESSNAEITGWLHGADIAYLGQSLARCRGGFVRAEGASRTRGSKRSSCGWMPAGSLTDQSRLVETSFDNVGASVAVVLEGTVTEKDLASVALSFEGITLDTTNPWLVPFDGKTLIVHSVKKSDDRDTQDTAVKGIAMTVRVAGQAAGVLEGVIVGQMSAQRLVSRMVNGSIHVDMEAVPDPDAKSITAFYNPPADIKR